MAEVATSSYGKNTVRLMRVRPEGGARYSVTELSVDVRLELSSSRDYLRGDNTDVVATDSLKNTVLVLAKRTTINSPEEFGLLVVNHFITTYSHVVCCNVYIEQSPWQRIQTGGAEHSHAFVLEPTALRFCHVALRRGAGPQVFGGLRDMKIFKPTQSGFKGFIRDQFTSLPETDDRPVCTKVYAKYEIARGAGRIDYNATWSSVKAAILEVFSGPPATGAFSPSVQKTMFEMSRAVFAREGGVASLELHLPNIHYFTADLSAVGAGKSGELLVPVDDPHGIITATFTRDRAKL